MSADILDRLEAHREGLDAVCNLLVEAVGEILTLREQAERSERDHAEALAEVERTSWHRLASGLYVFRESGFTQISPETAWTPDQLGAWLALAGTISAASDAVLRVQEPCSAADIARAVFAAVVRAKEDEDDAD